MFHISHTQLNMMERCGEQYRQRYIEGIKIPPSVAFLVGRSTHEGIEFNLRNKLQTGDLAPLEAVQEFTRDSFIQEWDTDGVLLNEEEKYKGIEAVKGEAIDTAIDLSVLHYKELAPKIDPEHIERPWKIDIQHYDCYLTGRIDIQEKNGAIRDTKTRKITPSKEETEKNTQLTFYALAAYIIDKKLPPVLYLDYLVKTKSLKAITHEIKRDEHDFVALLRRLETMIIALEKGVFMPANPDSWWCSEKWCGYWHRCKYIRSKSFFVNTGDKDDGNNSSNDI